MRVVEVLDMYRYCIYIGIESGMAPLQTRQEYSLLFKVKVL